MAWCTQGFTVDVCHDGVRGFAMACEVPYDAIVLDVMLPGLSGYEITRRLRAKGVWTPILLASAKDGEYDQADGLDLGADDYLTKPFSFVVLLARLRALLRRSAAPRPVTLVVGALELDPAARTVSVEGAAVDLTAREYAHARVPHAAPRHGGDQGRPVGARVGRPRDRPQRGRGLRRLPATQDRSGTAGDGARRGVPTARLAVIHSGARVRRSLRARVTVVATAVLAVGLVAGSAFLARLFVAERVAAVDRTVKAEAARVVDLAADGDLPKVLPSPLGNLALAQVVDTSGLVLANTPGASPVLPIVPVSGLNAGPRDRTYTATNTSLSSLPERVDVRTVAYGGTSVVVIVAFPFSDVQDTLNALHRVLFIVLPIVLLAAATATWLSVGSALRPVDELRAAADAVVAGGGKAAPQLEVPQGAEELRRLGETLNRMLARVHGAGEQQRAFIADAAHELRSPLASVLTQLEVALSTPTSAEEWPVIAADVYADAERLRRLADDLLLLARLDAGAPASDDLVDVAALAGAQGEPLLVRGDEQSLRRVFDNLITNAHKHSATVQVSAERVGPWALVVVDDDGPGVPVEDRERVFERFVRLDSARSRDEGGTGLGLAIARAVARSHDGDVVLSDSPLGGLRATVRLPADES